MTQENEPHMQPMSSEQQSQQAAAAEAAASANPSGANAGQPGYAANPATQQYWPQGQISTAGGFPQAMPQMSVGQPPQYGVPYYGYPQPMGWAAQSTPQFNANGQISAAVQPNAAMQQAPNTQPKVSAQAGTATYPMPNAQTVGAQQQIPNMQSAPQQQTPPAFVEHQSYMEPSFAHTMNGGVAPGTNTAESQFDYNYISTPARIAVYDSLKTAPRVIQVDAGPTHEYIEHIASITYKSAKEQGGMIPYTVIREVSENFIHAKFNEVVVSIFDQGNTIRFADQGPGIKQKELAQEPGFSSAVEPMKRYIRGVGSGLPIVKDYLSTAHGHIEIEDNVDKGSVVTISLVAAKERQPEPSQLTTPELTENEERILRALLPNKIMGVTDMHGETEIPLASIHTAFSKMEENGWIEKVNKKRTLTAQGTQIALSL